MEAIAQRCRRSWPLMLCVSTRLVVLLLLSRVVAVWFHGAMLVMEAIVQRCRSSWPLMLCMSTRLLLLLLLSRLLAVWFHGAMFSLEVIVQRCRNSWPLMLANDCVSKVRRPFMFAIIRSG